MDFINFGCYISFHNLTITQNCLKNVVIHKMMDEKFLISYVINKIHMSSK